MKLHSKLFSIFSLKTVAFLLFIISISNAKLKSDLIYGEPGNNKIRLFFFADGYIESQKNYYNDKVQSLVDTLFTISPFKEYKNLFTAYRVWTPSESAVPTTEIDQTFFGVYCIPTSMPKISNRGLNYFSNIINDTTDTSFQCDQFSFIQQSIIVFEGITNNPGVTYRNQNLILLEGDGDCLAHELGHSIGALADEYTRSGYTGSVSAAANVTKNKILDSIPWKYWIENGVPIPTPETSDYQNVIGLFEGANYYDTGWYRPSMDCIMQGSYSSHRFCNICKEYLTYKILCYRHSTLRKDDHWEWSFQIPGTKQNDYVSFFIDSIYPSPINSFISSEFLYVSTKQMDDNHPVTIEWYSKGEKINCTGNKLDLSQFTGILTINAILNVSSESIINPNYKTIDSISWVLKLENSTETNISFNSKGISNKVKPLGNGIYLVPKSQIQSFRVSDLLGRNIPFQITSTKTDYITVQFNTPASNRYIIKY